MKRNERIEWRRSRGFLYVRQEPRTVRDLSADRAARLVERERLIVDEIEDARLQGRLIDDLTAKRIARELDPGSGPLHDFLETGAVPPGVEVELAVAEELLQDQELEERVPWVTALSKYLDGRVIRSKLPDWNDPSME